MERKSLTLKELRELCPNWKLKKRAFISKFVVEKETDKSYCVKEIIILPFYIAIFPLATVIELLCCIWDGGLKSFVFFSRRLFQHTVYRFEYGFDEIDKWFKN